MNDKTAFLKQFKTFLERRGKVISLTCFCVFTAALIGIGAASTFKKANAEKEILQALESGGKSSFEVSVNGAVKNEGTAPLQRGSTAADEPAHSADGKININTASTAELMSLPGIGEVTAQKIVDYREKNGNFTNTAQLKNIEGIGDKTFDAIKDSITLE